MIRSAKAVESAIFDPPNPRLMTLWPGKSWASVFQIRMLELPTKRIAPWGGGLVRSLASKALISGSHIERSRGVCAGISNAPIPMKKQRSRLAHILAQFHVPISEIDEMLPAFVLVQTEVDLHERTPLGPFRFANQVQAHFLGRMVCLACVTRDAGADDVLPGGGAAAVAGNDMIEVQILAIERLAAVLAGVLVPLENVVAGELDLLLGQPVKHNQQDDPGYANFEGDGMNAFGMRLLLGKVLPLAETERLEGTVFHTKHRLGVA